MFAVFSSAIFTVLHVSSYDTMLLRCSFDMFKACCTIHNFLEEYLFPFSKYISTDVVHCFTCVDIISLFFIKTCFAACLLRIVLCHYGHSCVFSNKDYKTALF